MGHIDERVKRIPYNYLPDQPAFICVICGFLPPGGMADRGRKSSGKIFPAEKTKRLDGKAGNRIICRSVVWPTDIIHIT